MTNHLHLVTVTPVEQRIEEIKEKLTILNISLNMSEESSLLDFRAKTIDEIEHLEQELEDLHK